VAVDLLPFFVLAAIEGAQRLRVDEVASLAVETIPDVSEGKARTGFVGMIIGHVVS
jgi:hypothetical protein